MNELPIIQKTYDLGIDDQVNLKTFDLFDVLGKI